jgi:hypothetical protein
VDEEPLLVDLYGRAVRGHRSHGSGPQLDLRHAHLRAARRPRLVVGRRHAQRQPCLAAVLGQVEGERQGGRLARSYVGQLGRSRQSAAVREGQRPLGGQPLQAAEVLAVGDPELAAA